MTTVLEPSPVWPATWAQARRPWLNMYGLRLRPSNRESPEQAYELAPIQQLLPEEMMLKILGKLPPYELGRAACVCQQWRELSMFSELWKSACYEAFMMEDAEELESARRKVYRGSWRSLFLHRPHLRFDGLYVSRNTYIRTGVTEWRTKNPVHLVTYFRYLLFFPDGTFATRTSPEVVSKVAKSMRKLPLKAKADDPVQAGYWLLKKNWLRADIQLHNQARTEIRTTMQLRSTSLGSNNRLDINRIMSYDRGTSAISMIESGGEDEDLVPGAERFKRGTSTYVFVPNEEVQTHILNQTDLAKMDFFLPG